MNILGGLFGSKSGKTKKRSVKARKSRKVKRGRRIRGGNTQLHEAYGAGMPKEEMKMEENFENHPGDEKKLMVVPVPDGEKTKGGRKRRSGGRKGNVDALAAGVLTVAALGTKKNRRKSMKKRRSQRRK